jgi:hypothetical protein
MPHEESSTLTKDIGCLRRGRDIALITTLNKSIPPYIRKRFRTQFALLSNDWTSHLIEDVTQEVILDALQSGLSSNPESDSVCDWARKVSRNKVRRALRAKKRESVELSEAFSCEPVADVFIGMMHLRQLIRLVEAGIVRTHNRKNAKTLFLSFCLYVEHATGIPFSALQTPPTFHEKGGNDFMGKGLSSKQGRARRRKQRQRGREAARAILESDTISLPGHLRALAFELGLGKCGPT